ncbi:hypothetical protein [Phytohabitans houttuyneae]|jgi:hypothetical protein|nr:hypothetical protein [Phytohabitans houttuyneae]
MTETPTPQGHRTAWIVMVMCAAIAAVATVCAATVTAVASILTAVLT